MLYSRNRNNHIFLIHKYFACLVNPTSFPQGNSKLKEQAPMTCILHVSMTTAITEKGKKLTYIKQYAL